MASLGTPVTTTGGTNRGSIFQQPVAPAKPQPSTGIGGALNSISNALGAAGNAVNSSIASRPAPPPSGGVAAPRAVDTYSPGALMSSQYSQAAPVMQQNQTLGQGLQAQGTSIAGQQQAQANAYNQAGQSFNATSQNVAARPTGFVDPRTGQAQMTPGLQMGQQLPLTGGTVAPKALSTSQLGATPQSAGVGNVAGSFGAVPGAVNPNSLGAISQVASGLGGGYQVGNVGGIAGRLGAAPSVGQVGNIQMQAGPGAIAGQLGNQGASNADQQGMLARLNGFLDAPDGPSIAQAQLQQSQADNMANLIGAARSGRGGAGAQAQALRGAMSEGSALMSDTAGQLATLRAQEADMLKNRQLNAIGLGGQMSEAQRAQDLGFRGQNLQALQGDQGAALQGRGQDLTAAMANQSTQTALEQLQAQTALGARGQNLSALQGDQSTALGLEGLRAQTATTSRGQDLSALTADQQASIAARGQNLGALQGNQQVALGARGQNLTAAQGDQSTQAQLNLGNLQAQLGARGQDLSLLQGNQSTALGARGQDVTRELGLANVNMGLRGQDAGVLMSDADRDLAAQRLGLDAGLGYGNLANTANAQGLQYLSQANQQALGAQGLQNDLLQTQVNNQTSLQNTETAGRYGIQTQALANQGQPSFGESLAIAGMQNLGPGMGIAATALSDERAKTDIQGLDAIKAKLDDHLRSAPAHGYRYKPGFGEDSATERAGPMAQELEHSPFGRDIVKVGADGYRRVDTGRLALVNHAALASMRSELDKLKAMLEA